MSKPHSAPTPTLSTLDGIALIAGVVIGVGIFKTPSLVAMNVESGWTFMGVWLLGGLITLLGALCYAELGAARPHAGGEYHYISSAYGHSAGLLFGWARGTVIQTGAIAGVAFVYGDYAAVLLPLGPHGPTLHAATAVIAITALNLAGTLHSKRMQVALTAITTLAILLIALAGLSNGAAPPSGPTAASTASGSLGLTMVFVLITYGGWNEAAYLTAELKDVRRRITLTLLLATIGVMALYLLVNFAYLRVFGLEGMRASSAIGADLMKIVAGNAGALLLSAIVCVSALTTLNATIFTGARVYYALGRDLREIGVLGVWNRRGQKPGNALLLQGAVALALVGFGGMTRDGFEAMVAFTAPVFWLFLLLTALSLFYFRRSEPGRPLPFRVPLYPLTPALFAAACAWMLYSSIVYSGPGALIGIGVLLAGTPLLLWARRRPAPAPDPAE